MLRIHLPLLALPACLFVTLLAGAAAAHEPGSAAGTGELRRGSANPILRNDGPDDEIKVGPSTVVKAGSGDYRQWYEAIDGENAPRSGDFLTATGYATSTDGTTWVKRGVVLTPLSSPSWENSEACPTSMHWDGSKWILFYHGGNNSGTRAISRATSATGSGAFQRVGRPILERGSPGTWDERFVADAKVVAPWEGPDELWRMYYIGRNAGGKGQVGLATSSNGVDFVKVGPGPMLGFGPPGSWDGSDIQAFTPEWDPSLRLFRGWYVSGGSVGYAWSRDGVSWSRSADPVLRSVPGDNVEDSIDAYLDGGRYRVVYGQYDLAATPNLRGKGEAWHVGSTVETPEPAPDPVPTPSPEPTPTPPPAPPARREEVTAAVAVASSSDDGDVERGSREYPPAPDAPSYASSERRDLLVRRSKTKWPYQPVRVTVLRFDTSWLPDDAVVQAAELQLHFTEKTDSDSRSLVAEWYRNNPWGIGPGDWTWNDVSTAHTGTTLHDIATGRQNTFALTNLRSIDVRGATALRLHISRGTLAPTGPNDLSFAAFDDPRLPPPVLVVRYSAPVS